MRPEEIRKKSEKELRKMLGKERRRLVDLKLKLKVGELQDTTQLRKVKKNIAQFLTILKEQYGKKET